MRSWQLNIFTCTYCVQHVQPRVLLVPQVGFNIMAENKPVLRVDILVDAVLTARRACVEAVEIHHQALSQCGEQRS